MWALIGTSWGCTSISNRWLQTYTHYQTYTQQPWTEFTRTVKQIFWIVFWPTSQKWNQHQFYKSRHKSKVIFIPDQTPWVNLFFQSDICLFEFKDLFISIDLLNPQHLTRDALSLENHITGSDAFWIPYKLFEFLGMFVLQYRWPVRSTTVKEELLPLLRTSILTFRDKQNRH